MGKGLSYDGATQHTALDALKTKITQWGFTIANCQLVTSVNTLNYFMISRHGMEFIIPPAKVAIRQSVEDPHSVSRDANRATMDLERKLDTIHSYERCKVAYRAKKA